MLYNRLDSSVKREIDTCNFNQHIKETHAERILKEHDLIYIKEGEWSISQDGVDYNLSEGDVILLQGGHHHYGVEPCETVVKTRFIHFSTSATDEVGENLSGNGDYIFPIVVKCQNNPMVEHYFNRIISTYWSEDEFAKKRASAYLDLCLCEICKTQGQKTKDISLIEDIKLFIRKTPSRFIKNEELASRFNCSERTLSSKFKKATGYTLHSYQMKIKCEMADELMLHDKTVTLKEIAMIYGFYDEYHFSKCYKKHFGYSPIKKVK